MLRRKDILEKSERRTCMRKIMGKKFRYTAIFVALLISMTGCGEKKKIVEDDYGKVETATPGDVDINNGTDIDDVIEWKDEYVFDGNILSLDISTVDYSKKDVGVYKYNKAVISNDDRKNYLLKMTDGGIYNSDFDKLPKSVFETELEYRKNAYEYNRDKNMDDKLLSDLENQIAIAPDDFTKEDDFSKREYLIDYMDCIYYTLIGSYNEQKSGVSGIFMEPYQNEWISLLPAKYDLAGGTSAYCGAVKYSNYGDINNDCSMTKQEIEAACRSYLDRLGIEGFKVVGIKNLQWLIDGNFCGYYGYEAVLQRSFDNIPVSDSQHEYEEISENGEVYQNELSYGTECIFLYVDDRGVLSFQYNSMTENTRTITEHTALLDFESIKAVVTDRFANQYKDASGVNINYDSVSFCYVNVANPADMEEITAVPAWCFTNSDKKNPPLVINAIDGTVIDTTGDIFYMLEWGM